MEAQSVFQWLQDTSFATIVRQNGLIFPLVESIHVLAITLVTGSIAVVDLRLLGVRAFASSVRELMAAVLPFTWTAFTCAALSGITLFSANAVEYAQNGPFCWKLVLLGLAGTNMLIFHLVTCRSSARWDEAVRTPLPVRLTGAVSLLIWVAITACGRWIGFVEVI